MDNILLSSALAFLITFFSIPIIIQIAKEKKLYDEPDERKVHKNVTPTLGGLGIFSGFIVATLMGVPSGINPEFQYFVAAFLVIFFLGLKDDVMILSASKKFIGQVLAAIILIQFAGIELTNMFGFLGIYAIPPMASFAFTLFTIVVITNAFNLIDGVDGLAGTVGLITSFTFGLYFFDCGMIAYAVLAFTISASTIAFLIYNFSPAKIFMGDTGSLLLGTINSILVIKFISVAGAPDAAFHISSAPAIGFAILIVPLFDTLRVFAMRISKRRSPFSPDRNHIHHFLLDMGFSHRKVTYTIALTAISFIVLAYALHNLDTTLLIGILLVLAGSLTVAVYQMRKNYKKARAAGRPAEESFIRAHKIIGYTQPEPEIAEM